MSREALQYDLFTGELVDARSPREKRRDKQRNQLQQTEMFPQKDLAQFGVRANPQLPLSPMTRLELAAQDPRTEDDKEHDRMRAAEAQTYSFLDTNIAHASPTQTKRFPSGLRLPLIQLDEPELACAIQLTDKLSICFWSNRDEEYARLRDEFHLAGNEVYSTGDNQLEIWRQDKFGYFLISYSEMDMIENIEWIHGQHLT